MHYKCCVTITPPLQFVESEWKLNIFFNVSNNKVGSKNAIQLFFAIIKPMHINVWSNLQFHL
jgi:hypothetical protein